VTRAPWTKGNLELAIVNFIYGFIELNYIILPDIYPASAFDVKTETSIAYAWVSSRISEYLLSVFGGESDG